VRLPWTFVGYVKENVTVFPRIVPEIGPDCGPGAGM
jgi:hypothetical protein